jgi:two-component system response regulator FimZ (fimbrial Z protein)/two-component system response regulator EvgA
MRLILADHHEQPRLALTTLLKEQSEFNLLGEAMDGQGLLILADKCPADVILLDSDLPGIYIENLITKLHALLPCPIVIVMSSEFEKSRKFLRAGADAFVSKSDQPEWLLETLKKYNGRVKEG